MNKMDELKHSLLALKPGETLNVDEATIAEALLAARDFGSYYAPAQQKLKWWCEDNDLRILYVPTADYLTFEKVANAV